MSMLALAFGLALSSAAQALDTRVADADRPASGLDLLDVPTYDQIQGGSGRREVTLAGLMLDGRELPAALALKPAAVEDEAEVAVEGLLLGLGLEPRIAEDGGWLAETPLGLARLPRARLSQSEGIDYATLGAVAQALGIDLRYDAAATAVIATTTWPLVRVAVVPAAADIERPTADDAAPAANLSYWRTEGNFIHSGGETRGQVFSDVGGGLAGGFWRARYVDDFNQARSLSDYAWVRTQGRQRYLLGNQRVNGHTLLSSFELTGAQMAWTNRPDSLFGSRLGYGELVSGRVAPSSQLRGSGPPGGVAELRYDGIVVARLAIALDGRYEFRDVQAPRGTSTRIQVALFERGGLGAPVRIEDRSGQTSDQLLERGTVLHYAGIGEQGNPLDPDETHGGSAAFYEGRYGLLPGLTVDVSGQQVDGRDQWLAGGVASLGALGVFSGHLAQNEGRRGWLVAGEGRRESAFWRVMAREEDARFRHVDSLASHERYLEAGVRGTRWALAMVGRDIEGDFVSEPVRYLKPSLDWYPTDRLYFSARPDFEGNYQYTGQWSPGMDTRISAFFTRESDRVEVEQRLSDRWRVNAGRVEFQDRRRHSLLLSRNRLGTADLGLTLGALESEGRFGYLAALDKELRPGVSLRLQAFDDPLAYAAGAAAPVVQLGIVADFAVTPEGLSAGYFRRSLVDLGGIAGRLNLPTERAGTGAAGVQGASVWLDGQLRAQVDGNGRFHVRDLKPGVYRIQVDEGNLPIEMRLVRAERWVEVRAGVVTPVSFVLSLRLGFAGQVRGADGAPLGALPLVVVNGAGERVATATSDAWGYYRVDDLPPGTYRIRSEAGASLLNQPIRLENEFKFGVDVRQPAGTQSR